MVRKIGLNVDTVRLSGSLKNLEEELKLASRLGLELAEIPPAGLNFILNGKLISSKLCKVLEVLNSFPIEYTVHMPDTVNLAQKRQEDFEIASAVLEFARIIKARVIVYHCSSHPDSGGFENEVCMLSALMNSIGDDELVIGVENLDQDVRWIVNLCKEVNNPRLRLTLDVGHLFLHCKGNVSMFLDQLKHGLPHAIELHIHDNFGKSTDCYEKGIAEKIWFAYLYGVGDLHLPIGMGSIPFKVVFELINEYFDGYVVMEINDLNRFQEDIADSIRLIRDNCRCN